MFREGEYHAILDFCQQISSKITDFHKFVGKLAFSDKKTSHISGEVNGRFWGMCNFKGSGNLEEASQN
jgi:hypothetical protein